MFYTKYRPQIFSEISRPNEAADALVKEVVSKKTVHAYLFVGPRGTGKTSTARILAKALNCEHLSKNGDPCDACASCLAIIKGSYLDLIEIDAASNRGIDDIRELKNKVKLAPLSGKTKIYIIDEVHMLTSEAFNALLKTLEEPPKNIVFILCTTESHKVPETIKSRCQVFKFKRATIKQLTEKLSKIADNEAVKIEKDDLEKIARASQGGFRDAETMLQQIAEGDATVENLLNVGSREKHIEFVDLLVKLERESALRFVNKMFSEGVDLYVWSGELVKHFRDLLLIKSGITSDLLEIGDDLLTSVKNQATELSLAYLLQSLTVFAEAQSKIKSSFIPQLPLEIAIVSLTDSETSSSVSEKSQPIIPLRPISNNSSKGKRSIGDTDPVNDKAPSVSDNKNYDNVPISFNLASVESNWATIIEKITDINKSILGLLRSAKPVAIEGSFVIMEVNYSFHKERLESPKNRDVVEKVIKDIMGSPARIKCVVTAEPPKKLATRETGMLTDYNVVTLDKSAALEMLDGGLPL